MLELVLPFVVMITLIITEAMILQYVKKVSINWPDIIFNLNSGHLMLWLFRGLELVCYHFIYTHFSFNLFVHVPIILTWLFTLVAWDFGFYWEHRLHHKIPLLWAIHMVHHQGEHFNLSLAIRNSWYSSLTSIPFFALLAIAGVPTPIFIAVSIFHYSIQFFNHNAITPKLGLLEQILVTPTHHKVHHLKDQYYANSNFSGSFIIWDKLFGTFETTPTDRTIAYGSHGIMSQNPFWASMLPFMKMLNILYTPSLGHYRLPNALLVSGGLFLFGLVLSYVYDYGYGYHNVNAIQYLLFSSLVLGSIALGGMAEGKRWGMISWFGLCWLMLLFFIILLQWSAVYWQLFMGLMAIHGTITFAMWLKGQYYVN
ncbi:fatty acid hydroxylase [Snodgrassella communis]|jgi:sterol desaturase/sphingolipid hydroxylase (fatty acid hydroxylase superfamily)|uniref:C-5 sterol desaturase n=1 Tax=Snodgrassella communis TaxID=2946699 RepID=A0A837AGL7_9NEIS|nr:C-5 sterol desaturase [Snodgrassella communis]PIT07212.1 fatty acid hydroxylase [Snodgrassella communis]PIT26009.1 fatty acid hydroxylase [Snodgrassella communis]PIT27653.1 fatty acid hydroxylase [Snodgrassella communis]PIT31357.1 fatty acid hydroxylase [Snodgrassella communis]